MREEITQAIANICHSKFGVKPEVELTRPEGQFGDYSTNVAMKLAGQLDASPLDIANDIRQNLKHSDIEAVEVAGPGFLNLTLSDEALLNLVKDEPDQIYKDQEILVEFGDPNPFKAMHIGHLYSYISGDGISKLLEAAGAKVKRLSYHGDVGLHVAKAIWGMKQGNYDSLPPDDPLKNNIGLFYAKGAKAYEEDKEAKKEIDELNQKIYANDESLQKLYAEGKERSFANFKKILNELVIKNDRNYVESEAAELGAKIVKENIGKVFKESEGAVVFDGKKAGLHTRVFLTSQGLPTYETKDLGLAELKDKDYPKASLSIIITAHEQADYFKVMLAALKKIKPEIADKTKHLSHGFVSLSSGKMSSRTGDVYHALSLIGDVNEALKEKYPDAPKENKVAAIKYAFIKHRLGSDLIYDIEESISLEGNSGPYLQYSHARARSILAKQPPKKADKKIKFDKEERKLVKKIGEYTEVVNGAVLALMPHTVANYLYELAQTFNSFYEKSRVIGDARQDIRLNLVKLYADRLKNGLELLNIHAPDKM